MDTGNLAEEIDLFGRMTIALMEIESCPEFCGFIPEVRTNIVYARPGAGSPGDLLAIDGRITVVGGMPRAAGRIRFGASSHLARLVTRLMKTDPAARAGINFANPPGLTSWLSRYCTGCGWSLVVTDRDREPEGQRGTEGSSMTWKADEAVRAAGGRVPKVICDTGGRGKEPVCVITGGEPVAVARELCGMARAYALYRQDTSHKGRSQETGRRP